MRKTYQSPMMMCEAFEPNEYIAVCYKAKCEMELGKAFGIDANGDGILQQSEVSIRSDVGHFLSHTWGGSSSTVVFNGAAIKEAEESESVYLMGNYGFSGVSGGTKVYKITVNGTDHYILPPDENGYERDYVNHS